MLLEIGLIHPFVLGAANLSFFLISGKITFLSWGMQIAKPVGIKWKKSTITPRLNHCWPRLFIAVQHHDNISDDGVMKFSEWFYNHLHFVGGLAGLAIYSQQLTVLTTEALPILLTVFSEKRWHQLEVKRLNKPLLRMPANAALYTLSSL